MPWALSFAFGALISATDPVAVIAFFKSLGTPKRLSMLVEGESLFNDAVAVVVFGVALTVAEGDSFSLGGALSDFFVVSAGGLAVGLFLGYIVSEVVLANVDDALIETSTTLAIAFGSYLLAEEFGALIGQDGLQFSGILAVVAAGLMVGNRGIENTSPTARQTLEHFWELLTFLVNSLVFLFIGLTIGLQDLLAEWWPVLLAVVTVLVIRAILVYGLTSLTDLVNPAKRVPTSYKHVMFWGGLRGAISLALALIIDGNEALAEVVGEEAIRTVVVMTFGVVLFTLLVQGLSITGLIRRLGLAGRTKVELEQQTRQAVIATRRAGQAAIGRLGADGVIGHDLADALATVYAEDVQAATDALRDHLAAHPALGTEMLLQARREADRREGRCRRDRSNGFDRDSHRGSDHGRTQSSTGGAGVAQRTMGQHHRRRDNSMILYLSIAGATTSDTLEQALIVAVEAETELRYVAVVDDQQFGDVDKATMDMVAGELEFLLRAQLIAVRRRVTSSPNGHVVIHRGTAVDAVVCADDDVDEVLIGGPLALEAAVVSELIEQIGRRAGVGVRVLTG